LNRGDDGFAVSEEPDGFSVEVRNRLPIFARSLSRAVERASIAEIRAGAESLALRRKHDGAAAGVLVERFERAGDLADQSDIEEIVGRSPNFDESHETRLLDADISERTHLIVLSLLHQSGMIFLRITIPLYFFA
jgi:hypothetical protein